MYMHPNVNYLAVLVVGIVIFALGGLWYSNLLFAKPWTRLIGKTEEELRAGTGSMPLNFGMVFVCSLLISWVMAVTMNHFQPFTTFRGALVGVLCWVGFAGATSYGTAIFSGKPKALWAIDSGYNLVSFVVAGIIHALWHP